jgi:glutamate-1-semialdehyde 2,1-aminomutase
MFRRAQRVLPGGVNSPMRSFRAVGGTPRFIEQGQGSRIFDLDNLQYIDCVGSGGPLILGHAHRYVVEAVKRAATRGFSFGGPTLEEAELAETICGAMPSVEMVRLVSSGTEATASAIRIARAATRRKRILKFDGGYHGSVDPLLVNTGSVPYSAGIPEEFLSLTVSVPYNNLEATREVLGRFPGEFAAVLVEPVASHMGCVPPRQGFLQGLRQICDETSTLLIFDEVATGFRVAYGGAQTLYEVRPDLTTLGNVIGGGLPLGAYGGRRTMMEMVAPLGPVFQGGTLSGNPVAVAAGRSTLSILKNEGVYHDLEERSQEFEAGVTRAGEKHGVTIQLNRVGSMWTVFFTDQPVVDLESARRSNLEKYARFFNLMLAEGVYLPPSQFETAYFSSAHAKKDVQQLVERTDRVLKKVAWEFER